MESAISGGKKLQGPLLCHNAIWYNAVWHFVWYFHFFLIVLSNQELQNTLVTIIQHFIISLKNKGNYYPFLKNKQSAKVCTFWNLNPTIDKSVVVCGVKGRRVIHHFSLCIPEVHESIVYSHIYSVLLRPIQSSAKHSEKGQTMTHY